MPRLNSFFIVLSILVVSTQAVSVDPAMSSYCEKSKRFSFWYYPTPSHCCREICDKYIEPGATKYGLANPNSEWTLRHCDCDIKFYRCVTEHLNGDELAWTRKWGFSNEQCFRELTRPSLGKQYGPVGVLDAVQRQNRLDCEKAMDAARKKSSASNSRRKRRQLVH